jgi:predicted AlkP superfamily phosphohydrolase/phosphomutase
MKLKDFKETKRLLLKGEEGSFCESCFQKNPEVEEGYTMCCNERIVDFEEALTNAKQDDIIKFLSTKFKVNSNGIGYSKIFNLKNKNKSFEIYLKETNLKKIIEEVKENIKGLRSEFKSKNNKIIK